MSFAGETGGLMESLLTLIPEGVTVAEATMGLALSLIAAAFLVRELQHARRRKSKVVHHVMLEDAPTFAEKHEIEPVLGNDALIAAAAEGLTQVVETPKIKSRRAEIRDQWREQVRATPRPSNSIFSHEFEGQFYVCGFRKKGLGAGKHRLEIVGDKLYFDGVEEPMAPNTVHQIKAQLLRERALLEETK